MEKIDIGKNKHFTAVHIFIESVSKLGGLVGIRRNDGTFLDFCYGEKNIYNLLLKNKVENTPKELLCTNIPFLYCKNFDQISVRS